jgi:hypothetical protein
MEKKNRSGEAMEFHKQGCSNGEIAEIMGISVKNVGRLLSRARNPRIHEIQGHYKKIIMTLDDEDISIRGKYLSLTLTNLLLNISLQQDEDYHDRIPKTYNLVEFLYHNIWSARISISGGQKCMIDSDGFQHELADICDFHSYNHWLPPRTSGIPKEVFFPWPDLTIEAKAKTRGWWWLRPLRGNILPCRFVIQISIYKPGDTSGWVQDHETLEFEFANNALVSQFAVSSYQRFTKGEIGCPS